MTQTCLVRRAVGICLAIASAPALAHHSAAMFEEKKTVTVEGVVKEFQFTNPHSWLLVDVKDKNGKVTTWGFEAEGPSTLPRAGIRPSEFPVGTKLTITGRPMKDGRPAAIWEYAVRATARSTTRAKGSRSVDNKRETGSPLQGRVGCCCRTCCNSRHAGGERLAAVPRAIAQRCLCGTRTCRRLGRERPEGCLAQAGRTRLRRSRGRRQPRHPLPSRRQRGSPRIARRDDGRHRYGGTPTPRAIETTSASTKDRARCRSSPTASSTRSAREGQLHAVDLAKGTRVWSEDTMKRFGVPKGFFGAAGSPARRRRARHRERRRRQSRHRRFRGEDRQSAVDGHRR